MPCTVPSNGVAACGQKKLLRAGAIAPSADGAKGLWRLSDATAQVCADSIGSSHGVYPPTGVTVGADGPFPGTKAARFDGAASSYITIPQTPALNVGDNFTVEAWIWGGTNPSLGGVACQSGAWYFRLGSATQIQGGKFGQPLIITGNTPDLRGSWHHVAWTKAAAVSKLYCDGLDVSGAVADQTMGNGTATIIGTYTGAGQAFPGLIYGVAIYPAALSAAQINAHALGKDVSALNLCQFHYNKAYGLVSGPPAMIVQEP